MIRQDLVMLQASLQDRV